MGHRQAVLPYSAGSAKGEGMKCLDMLERYGRKWVLFQHYRVMRNSFARDIPRAYDNRLKLSLMESRYRYTCEMKRAIKAMREWKAKYE